MYCPKCGRKIDNPENTKFCPNCGSKIESQTSNPKPVNAFGTREPRFDWNKWKFPIVGVVVLAIAIVIICNIGGKKQPVETGVHYNQPAEVTQSKEENKSDYPTDVPEGYHVAQGLPNIVTGEPTYNIVEDEPEYELAFSVYDLKDMASTNIFNFIDEWGGHRIMVDGLVGDMGTSYLGERYIRLRPLNDSGTGYDYSFYVTCYLNEYGGGENVKAVKTDVYCFIVGEVDEKLSADYEIVLKNCYVSSAGIE